ncbi:MAG: UDP-N-acetylmuramoyl-tripeptide--D-alanyl-D-alanine ligase [Clostridia bacterium]|nr:UDP-N-acetylmuramoyl-tripeptide--D-alanyl-D-alanine ligase [Clostridia bacterium]
MQKITCSQILEATGGTLLSGNSGTEIDSISTDSRKIQNGTLFIPLVGERFDGHDYIAQSLESGAAAALTQKDMIPIGDKLIIKVDDTLKALGRIAAYYRGRFNIPFVGVTGSVGKTSTKDMVATVLGQSLNILKTEGNFNNEIGLPLTIFNLDTFHEAAVIEMGMSGFGEISRLTSIVKPHVAIITNIGISHIEKLGSRQNILKAKLEILEGLRENGLVILNGDDNLLFGVKDMLKQRTVLYGMEEGLEYQAYNIKTSGEHGTTFEITIGSKDYVIPVPVPGVHNVYNALAAIAAGVELKIPMEAIIRGISEFSPSKMRLNIVSHGDIKIINDTYNASPQSMEAAINVLKDVAGSKRTIAVLGDMLEIGDWAFKAHIDVGKYAVSKGIDCIFTVGEEARNIAKGAIEAGADFSNVKTFDNNGDIVKFLKDFKRQNDVILIKGSRGMKMEQIVEKLTID